MKKIKSFTLNHNTHREGIFLSSVNNDIYTYDLRFKKPNHGDYILPAVAHTIEHLFATVIRNSAIGDDVIYFGPMGCRTGFYLLLRNVDYESAYSQIVLALKECLAVKEIPGNKKIECGAYRSHSLKGARQEIENYLDLLGQYLNLF